MSFFEGQDVTVWLTLGLLFVVGLEAGLIVALVVRQSRAFSKQMTLLEVRVRKGLEWQWSRIEERFGRLEEGSRTQWEELQRGWAERELRRAVSLRPQGEVASGRLEKRHKIQVLAEAGLTPREIARKLRLSLGETELLLGLDPQERERPEGYGARIL